MKAPQPSQELPGQSRAGRAHTEVLGWAMAWGPTWGMLNDQIIPFSPSSV